MDTMGYEVRARKTLVQVENQKPWGFFGPLTFFGLITHLEGVVHAFIQSIPKNPDPSLSRVGIDGRNIPFPEIVGEIPFLGYISTFRVLLSTTVSIC